MIMTIYLKYCKDVVDCGLVYKCVCMINRATEALDVHRNSRTSPQSSRPS